MGSLLLWVVFVVHCSVQLFLFKHRYSTLNSRIYIHYTCANIIIIIIVTMGVPCSLTVLRGRACLASLPFSFIVHEREGTKASFVHFALQTDDTVGFSIQCRMCIYTVHAQLHLESRINGK